jgi:predicted  nucleic acid-binding Zn-ribbon protein
LIPAEFADLHAEHFKLSSERTTAQAALHRLEDAGLDQQAAAADTAARGAMTRKAPGTVAVLKGSKVEELKRDRDAAKQRVADLEAGLALVAAEAVVLADKIDRGAWLDKIDAARKRVTQAGDELSVALSDASDAHQTLMWLRRIGGDGQSWGEGQADLSISLHGLNRGDPQAKVSAESVLGLLDARLAELAGMWTR